jgi:hypothetical protein
MFGERAAEERAGVDVSVRGRGRGKGGGGGGGSGRVVLRGLYHVCVPFHVVYSIKVIKIYFGSQHVNL